MGYYNGMKETKEKCIETIKKIKQSHINGTAPVQLYDDQFEYACDLIIKEII